MKPIDRRKLFNALHRGCRRRELELVEDPDAGRGSHGSLVFNGGPGCRPLRFVLVYAHDVSPGVQRGMLRYAAQQVETLHGKEKLFAQLVFELLKESFE